MNFLRSEDLRRNRNVTNQRSEHMANLTCSKKAKMDIIDDTFVPNVSNYNRGGQCRHIRALRAVAERKSDRMAGHSGQRESWRDYHDLQIVIFFKSLLVRYKSSFTTAEIYEMLMEQTNSKTFDYLSSKCLPSNFNFLKTYALSLPFWVNLTVYAPIVTKLLQTLVKSSKSDFPSAFFLSSSSNVICRDRSSGFAVQLPGCLIKKAHWKAQIKEVRNLRRIICKKRRSSERRWSRSVCGLKGI